MSPQLAATLRNTVKTGNTLVSEEQGSTRFLKDTTAFSNTTKEFLDANGDNIIRLGQLSEPILALLEPLLEQFPCMLEGIVGRRPAGRHVPRVPLPHQPEDDPVPAARLHRGRPPVLGANNGPTAPACPTRRSRTTPGAVFPNLNDGADSLGKGDNQRAATGFASAGTGSAPAAPARPSEEALINSLMAPTLGIPVDQMSDLATLLYVPMAPGRR